VIWERGGLDNAKGSASVLVEYRHCMCYRTGFCVLQAGLYLADRSVDRRLQVKHELGAAKSRRKNTLFGGDEGHLFCKSQARAKSTSRAKESTNASTCGVPPARNVVISDSGVTSSSRVSSAFQATARSNS
jgi:hypothetical protein